MGATKLFLVISVILVFSFTRCGGSSDSTAGGEKGETGATGATGASGQGISSNKKIDAVSTDRCDTDDLTCRFTGGQRVILGDNTVILTGEWLFIDSSAGNDTDLSSITMIIPSSASTAYKVLASLVNLPAAVGGTGSTRKMFMVYTVSTDAIELVWDKNGDGLLSNNATDVYLGALTKSAW